MMEGSTGRAPLTIGSGARNASGDANLATIRSGDAFSAEAQVLGTTSRLEVRGNFTFSGNLIQPRMIVTGIARLAAGATPMRAGNVSVSAGGSFVVQAATLTSGSSVFVEYLEECSATSVIRFEVPDLAAATKANFVLFKYGVRTFARIALFRCAIKLCQANTDTCIAVTNPSVTTTATGRRLLQTATASSSASWEPTQLSVSSPSSGSSTSAAASVSISAIVIAFSAMIALLAAKL